MSHNANISNSSEYDVLPLTCGDIGLHGSACAAELLLFFSEKPECGLSCCAHRSNKEVV